jgi:hypothetical protein
MTGTTRLSHRDSGWCPTGTVRDNDRDSGIVPLGANQQGTGTVRDTPL